MDASPRLVHALAQFDEHESSPFEDGELNDIEDTGPPPNQEALRSEVHEYAGNLSNFDFVGEHKRSLFLHGMEPTARKRSYSGSMTSEEGRRSARRPKVFRQESPPRPSLPSIRELVGNPWRGEEGRDAGSFTFPSAVPRSTPLRSPSTRQITPFYHDEQANVSGHAPTVRGASLDTTSSTAKELDVGQVSRTSSRATFRSRTHSMEVDEGPVLEGCSLLQRPLAEQDGPGAGRRKTVDGRRSLHDVLSEQDVSYPTSKERNAEELRRGGYRPRAQEEREFSMERERSASMADFGEGVEDEMDGSQSHFSALPNTKAWQYRQEKRREEKGHEYVPDVLRRRSRSRFEEDDTQATRARVSNCGWDEEDEGTTTGRDVQERETAPEWWQMKATRTRRLPTALMGEEDVVDVPRKIDNPHRDRWTIHLSDPEEWYVGMSTEWMKTVWLDEKPTVLLTVFNYKFTKNDEIKRHIESHVTTLTTQLTGETDFHVVPPEPEWRRELSFRELPSLWAIRGLSEEAAWEMISLKAISTRGVSIITHPRSLHNPRYVCGLAGFLRPDVKSTKLAVLSVLESDYMMQRLADLVQSNEALEHIPRGKRVERVIDSLDIRFMETKEDGWVANVFILPPTDDLDEWRQWAEEMRAYEYNLFLNGTGKARKAFWCGGCRGVDHEDPACPFPKSKGWKGPEAGDRLHTKYWAPTATRGRKPGRGQDQGRGGVHRPVGQVSMATPGPRGKYARGGPHPPTSGGRVFGGQRGGVAQRGAFTLRGGMRSDWSSQTPSRWGPGEARY